MLGLVKNRPAFLFLNPHMPKGLGRLENIQRRYSGVRMEGRFVDNANFFAIDDIDDISDGLEEIKKKGMIGK